MPEPTLQATPALAPLPGDVLLACGGSRALLRPAAGGRVCALHLADADGVAQEVLYPYTAAGVDALRWAKGGIYPLVPYSNRIAHSRLATPDGVVTLSPHPDAMPHTLHGNAHGLPWQLQQSDATQALLVLDSPASPAWPWKYRVTQEIRLQADALTLQLRLVNEDTRTMPSGLGFHPYFCHVPEARLGFQASTWWDRTEDFLATTARPVQADEGFMPARALKPGTCTDYFSGWDGRAQLELPSGATLHLQADAALGHMVLHRPPQPLYVCLEPVTHVADGFNLGAQGREGTGTVLLVPGESFTASLTLSLSPPTSTPGKIA
jgi:aldose 1-epimerase